MNEQIGKSNILPYFKSSRKFQWNFNKKFNFFSYYGQKFVRSYYILLELEDRKCLLRSCGKNTSNNKKAYLKPMQKCFKFFILN